MSAARTSDVVQQGVLHAIEHHFPKTNPMNYDFLDNIAGVDSLLDIVERGLKSRDSAVQTTTGGSVSIAARRWRPSGAEGKHRENERGCQTFGVRSLVFLTAVLPRVSWKYPFGRAFRVVLPAKPGV